MTTIGYGSMAPATTASNILVTLEAMVGLRALAVLTGLVFARFSKPSARILFSRVAVVSRWQGKPCLMFRLANHRNNSVVEAGLQVVLMFDEVSPEGIAMRRLVDLKLIRDSTPQFRLTWAAIHPIDEESPLHGVDHFWFSEVDAVLIASVIGIDETMAQPVHAKATWGCDAIQWNRNLVDIFSGGRDNRVIDYSHFHDTETQE